MRRAFRWTMLILIALGLISARWAIAGNGMAEPPVTAAEINDMAL